VLKLGYFEKEGQKYLGSFEIGCLRRMEKIVWADCVKNPRSITKSQEERNSSYNKKREG
jgi:hypothetical protein